MDEDSSLGFVLYPHAEPGPAGARESRLIGHVHDPGELQVIEFVDDGSTAVREAGTGTIIPLNRDRSRTERFLEAFDQYVAAGPDFGPAVFGSLDELRSAGAAKDTKRASLPHPLRYARLRAKLLLIDRRALGAEGWWAATVEEASHDLV